MTARLTREANIEKPDDFYEALIKLHEGLTEEQSRDINARLILILANHVGDEGVLRQALELARQDIP